MQTNQYWAVSSGATQRVKKSRHRLSMKYYQTFAMDASCLAIQQKGVREKSKCQRTNCGTECMAPG